MLSAETEDVWRGTCTEFSIQARGQSWYVCCTSFLSKRLEKCMCDAWNAEECDAVDGKYVGIACVC